MHLFFEPRSVVLIGTSRQTGPGAYNNLEMMVSYGYPGRIFLVHPKVAEIMGRPTYHRVADLPEVPDLAVISLGRDRVPAAVRDCVRHGIKHLVVISQGFADADDKGAALQEELLRLARKHGARVLGPNTMGVLNPFSGFTTAFIDIPRDRQPALLTMVAQSGAFQVGASSFTGQMGKAIDLGNACDLDVVDALDYLETDPQTRVIVLHLEGLRQGRDFLAAAARVARTKPIIALKTGRSTAGARAALSHTGSLAGEDAVTDVALAQAGIIRVRSLLELLAVSQAFLHFRPLAGPRLGVVTASGAFGIIAADCCEDYGLELAPAPAFLRDLEEERVAWHKLGNPVDIWPLGMVTGSFTGVFKKAVAGLFEDEHVDGVVGVGPSFTSPLHADLDLPGAVRELQAVNPHHKPLALLLYGDEPARRAQADDLAPEPDVACFISMDEAVMGLAATWRYRQFLQAPAPGDFHLLAPAAPRPVSLPDAKVLLGDEAQALLAAYDLPVVPGVVAADETAAATAADDLGYPVVLKIISPEWLHKSDLGGVLLGVATPGELRQAYQDLVEKFHRQTPGGRLDGILVQKEVGGTELLLGLKRDPQFGPVLVAGAGGIYTEILADVARALVPVSPEQAANMLASLKIYPILQGVRGRPGVDLAALTKALVNLSRLAVDYPEIRELDLNPVIAGPHGCWCVDCRIVLEAVSS
jgi:acyl-CoA synthetase (NDP forming)